MNTSSKIYLAVIGIFSILAQIEGYVISLEVGFEDECYHEKVPIGIKLGFSFEVVEGGFFDIDAYIKDPQGVVLYSQDKTSSGKVTIEANMEGAYQFCFSGKKSSSAPKMIIFNLDRSDDIKLSSDNPGSQKTDDETAKLMSMVESLMLSTVSSRHDVRFLTARDRIHRKINEKTNSNLVWWSGLEFILLLVVTLGQVWYLRRFFEIRRKA